MDERPERETAVWAAAWRRGEGDGQEDVSPQGVTLLGQKPGLLDVGVMSLPLGYIVSIRPVLVLPTRSSRLDL